jgi:hypothetical protein
MQAWRRELHAGFPPPPKSVRIRATRYDETITYRTQNVVNLAATSATTLNFRHAQTWQVNFDDRIGVQDLLQRNTRNCNGQKTAENEAKMAKNHHSAVVRNRRHNATEPR